MSAEDRTTDQTRSDNQWSSVGGAPSRSGARRSPTPIVEALPADPLDPGQGKHDTHPVSAGVDPSASTDRSTCDTHEHGVGAGTPLEPPVQPRNDIQGSSDGWLELRIWAEMFNDAQQQRIATVNRAERGGVDPEIYAPYTEQLEASEKVVKRQLILTYRRVVPESIRTWVKESRGLGEPLMARILGHLGHPRWATPHHWEGMGTNRVLITDPPFERTVGQLWQYCGHGAPGRAKKGATFDELAALGSPSLKMLVHLASECCMKSAGGPYRLVYEQARQECADKVHSVECVRCGPSGKPAQPGTPWSAGHQHAHALRITGKELLRDLWEVSG